MTAGNRVIVAMLLVSALAVAFWMLLLSPRREEVSKLDAQVARQERSLAVHQAEVQRGEEAKRDFASSYQDLVVLGKAAPAGDETASLLVQLNRIADQSRVRFETFVLAPASGGTAPPAESTAAAPVEGSGAPGGSSGQASFPSPTEVAASTLPLGAAIGPAGLAVMPYTLSFKGNFFQLADFIKGLDSLVETKNAKVEVTGRLITINGFTLKVDQAKGFPNLEASFRVTTFLVPPGQGVTGEATPSSPEPASPGTPVAATTGGTP